MPAYADTSFLFALVLHDANSAAVAAYLHAHPQALPCTSLQRCELRNAIRLAVFRKLIDPGAAQTAPAQIESDLAAGNLVETSLVWPEVLAEADRLGDRHTAALGIRTFDLLHVGAAVSLGLRDFLTFDNRQHACAQAAGLRVGP